MRRPRLALVLAGMAMALAAAAPLRAAQAGAPEQGTAAQAASAATGPVVAQVRIHGNYRTPDEEVLRLSGLTVGQALPPGGVRAVTERLKRAGRFDNVEVRLRYRTIDESGDVAIVIVVTEVPGSVIDVPTGPPMPPNPLGRLGERAMFSPLLEYVDEYGFTYGARASFVHALGKEGRLSVPVSWGGRKQAVVEVDKTFATGPVSRMTASGGWRRFENRGFDTDDDRREVSGEIVVPLKRRLLNLTLAGGFADVSFGDLDDRFTTVGAGLSIDTRRNLSFPRNAVFLSAGWRRFDPDSGPRVNRYRYEGQAYLGLVGSSVLALEGVSDTADRALPVYEKALAGGTRTLRGFRPGAFVGDNLAAGTVELRMPTHSAMRLGQNGFTLFADAAATYDHGTKLGDATWHYGVGAGWYLRAPMVNLNLDVAYGIDRGARVHVNAGFKF